MSVSFHRGDHPRHHQSSIIPDQANDPHEVSQVTSFRPILKPNLRTNRRESGRRSDGDLLKADGPGSLQRHHDGDPLDVRSRRSKHCIPEVRELGGSLINEGEAKAAPAR